MKKQFSLRKLLVSVLAGFAVLFVGMSGHSLFAEQGMGHGAEEMTKASSRCHSVCTLLPGEKLKTSEIVDEDTDPKPEPYVQPLSQQAISALYLATLALLAYLVLQRRPPDLVVLHSNYRF